MTSAQRNPAAAAIAQKGWLLAHKWLLLRRFSQLGILCFFLAGPWLGVWIVKGNLSSSLTLDFLPLTDPYLLLQAVFAGHAPEITALTGAGIVLVFYLLVGGRTYCSWVCPVNIVTDFAFWLRSKFGIKGGGFHFPEKPVTGYLPLHYCWRWSRVVSPGNWSTRFPCYTAV